MSQTTIKIAVASHKPYWTPRDVAYLPVQVGAAIPGHGTIDGFQRDDHGENISLKNASYCELTAIYWAWKNIEADYIGLVHYRRYFRGTGERGIAKGEEIAKRLSGNKILVPCKRRYYIETVYSHYAHAHHVEPLDIAIEIIKRDYPSASIISDTVMSQTWLHLYNMFIMSSTNFHRYCEWLFPILAEVESRIDTTGWTEYESRVYGFLAERLFNIWLGVQDGIEVEELPYISLEKQHLLKKTLRFSIRKFACPNKW